MSLICDLELSERLRIVKSYHLKLPCEFCLEGPDRLYNRQNLLRHKKAHLRFWIKHYESHDPAKIAKIGLEYFSSTDTCNAWWSCLDPNCQEELRQIKNLTGNKRTKPLVDETFSESECAAVMVDLLSQQLTS